MDNNETEDVEMKTAGMRRNLTLRSNVARQVAVNFMPSRQLPYNTLRLRRVNSERNALLEASTSDAPDAVEKQADIIVREMEQHQRLMEDNPVSEELRREALRDLPQGLTIKRNVRAKLSASVSLRSKRRPISVFKRLKYRISFACKRASERLRDLIFSIELWYEAIRNLEGHLGSAVGSYFHLLRWLFALDLALAALLIAFVVVPQVLHDETREMTGDRGFLDFVSGTGGFNDSLLFYGHYHAGDVASVTSVPLTYNMTAAYFYTMVSLYLVFFGVLCYRTAYSYRQNFIEIRGGLSAVFANKVFCGWDFGIVSHKAAALNANSLYNEFKELLNEQNRKKPILSWYSLVGQRAANLCVWLVVLAATAGLQYGLWRQRLALPPPLARWPLVVSAVITVALAVLPVLFNVLVRWDPKSRAPEFNIAYNSLTLIYNQAVLWLGALFAPLLPAAAALKLLLLFYVKRETALRACYPARKVWRAAQTQTILYMLVTLSLFATLFGLGVFFIRGSSPYCGPFVHHERVYHVVSEDLLGLSRHENLRAALLFLTRPGVIGFLMLFLCVAVYYMRAKANAQRSMVGILRRMLLLQAKDKDFLLAAIAKVSNGEWLYSPKPEEAGELDSHTWKYLHEVRKPSNAGYHFDASRLSHHERPVSYERRASDGDTDSSFSWQGSAARLRPDDPETGDGRRLAN